MSQAEVQESGEILVHFYSTEGDLHEMKVFKGTPPEDAVAVFSNSLLKDRKGWFEVYDARGNLKDELPVFDIWRENFKKGSAA